MADSIEKIAEALENLAQRLASDRSWSGSPVDDARELATRLRALSPAGGAHSELLEAILLEHADGLAAAAASLKAALAAAPQPQDAAATTRGELVVARDLLLRAMQDEKAEWTGDLRGAAYKALDDVLAKFDAASGQTPTGADGDMAAIGWKACRRQVFALCEHTQDNTGRSDFDRGRAYEAKGIAKAMNAFGPESCNELANALITTSAGTTGDAARYRWLRDNASEVKRRSCKWIVETFDRWHGAETLDAAIDAARRAGGVGK